MDMNPEQLVREHGPRLRVLAARLVGEGDADDVVQRAWVAAWKAKPRSPGAWLERVVRRIAGHHRRDEAAARERERRAARTEAGQDPTSSLERREALQALAAGLATLPDQWAEVVLLRHADGLRPREVAARLGIPVETVRSRARRGLAQLREELERRGTDWRPALALLAAPSPCEPAAAVSIGVLLMSTKTVTAVVLVLASVVGVTLIELIGNRPSDSQGEVAVSPDTTMPQPSDRQGAPVYPTGSRVGGTEADLETVVPPRTPVQNHEEESQEPETPVGNAPASTDPLAEKYGDLEGEELDKALEDLNKKYLALQIGELERYVAMGWYKTVPHAEATLKEGDTDHDNLAAIQGDGVTWRKIILTRNDSRVLFALRDEFHWLWQKRHGTPHPEAFR